MVNKAIFIFILNIIVPFMIFGTAFAKGDAMFASSTVNIYKDRAGQVSIGQLEVGAKVYLLKEEKDMAEISIKGWRQKGLKCVIYAFEGKRIILAELEPDGIKLVKVVKTVKDEDTQLVWERVVLNNVWIKSKYLVKDVNKVWSKISPLFHERCSMCHALPRTTTFTANQWPSTLRVMTKRAALTKKQADEITMFLQYHAKDVIKRAGATRKR